MKGNQCYPNISLTNHYSGFVKTKVLRNSSPWYLSGILAVGIALIGSLPESYAEVPFYLLANPGGRKASAKGRFWDRDVCQLKPHPSVQDETNRQKVWKHLLEMLHSNK